MFKFLRKNKEPKLVETDYDIQLKKLRHKLTKAWYDLEKAARDTIIKQGAFELYPNSLTKDYAADYLNEAKTFLLRKVEEFKESQYNYNEYLNRNKELLYVTQNYRESTVTGFEIVENVYKNFFNGR